MATISLSNPQYYKNGTSGVSAIVGKEGSDGEVARRIVRYEFTSPAEGASHITFSLVYAALLSKSSIKPLRFYIGTSSTSHSSAGGDAEYTGVVSATQYQSYADCYVFSGEASIILAPNTLYYLWIFPSTDEGWCYYNAATITSLTLTTSAGAGLVYIGNGKNFDAYQIYIDNGTSCDLYMPYIDNGKSWEVYT